MLIVEFQIADDRCDVSFLFFFFQAEDGIRDLIVTGVQTCALPICERLLLFPGAEDEPVVLAQLTDITLVQREDKWVLTGGQVDNSVRPSHVATTTIQDLLCGPLFDANGPEPSPVPEAGDGPRVVPDSVVLLTDRAIEFRVDKGLLDASVKPAAFSVTWLDPDKDADRGWRRAHIQSAAYGGDETKTVNLELRSAVSGHVRLIVYGTGPAPVLGADFEIDGLGLVAP